MQKKKKLTYRWKTNKRNSYSSVFTARVFESYKEINLIKITHTRTATRYTLRKMFSWINQILVGLTIEYGYHTDNQIFGWANKIFWIIKFGPLYQSFWLNQPNTMVNLKSVFAQANNNFVIAVIIIIFVWILSLKIIITIYYWKKRKK